METQQKDGPKLLQRKKKRKQQRQQSRVIGMNSYIDYDSICRPDSGSLTSSSGTLLSASQSSKSSDASMSHASDKSTAKSQCSFSKKRGDRGQLKVSINETAELIGDKTEHDELHDELHDEFHGDRRSSSDEHNENASQTGNHNTDSNGSVNQC